VIPVATREVDASGEPVIDSQELESAQTDLVLFAQRWLDYIINYANYIKRRMYKTGVTLPFAVTNTLREANGDLDIAVEIHVQIPLELVKKYVQLRKQGKMELPRASYITLKKIAGERYGEEASTEESELFKKDIYTDKV